MLLGPIFSLEMLTTARRVRYLVVRALYASILLATLACMYYESVRWSSWGSIHQAAGFMADFFLVFGVMQISVVLLVGPAMAAGTIAVERERRTIEYLFASDLSNAEIVFGKLIARFLLMVTIVLTGVPVLAAAMLMGGISPESLLVLTILTISTMAMVAVLSMVVSVWSGTTRDAVMRAYLILAALLIVPPCVWGGLTSAPGMFPGWVEWCNDQFLRINPFWVFFDAIEAVGGNNPGEAWKQVGAMLLNQCLITVAGALLAAWSVRRVRIAQRSGTRRGRFRLPRLRPGIGSHPMLWKEVFSDVASTKLGVAGRIAMAVLLASLLGVTFYQLWDTVRSPSSWAIRSFLQFLISMTMLVGTGILILIAARAASSITAERERDTWTSLLSAPLGSAEIVWAKIVGSIWAARWICAVLAGMLGLGVLTQPVFMIPAACMGATLSLLSLFVASLGVLGSLICRTSLRAMGMTISIGMFLGGGYLLCCFPVLSGPGDDQLVVLAPCMPFLIGVPGIVYDEISVNASLLHDEAAKMMVAYCFGMAGYAIATFGLISAAIGNFERWVGRSVPRGLLEPTYVSRHIPGSQPAEAKPEPRVPPEIA